MTRPSELNTFVVGDGDIQIFWLENTKISGPAFAGWPYMAILGDCREMNTLKNEHLR